MADLKSYYFINELINLIIKINEKTKITFFDLNLSHVLFDLLFFIRF